ncbi:MAG: electron transfer flavoprotein subunit beta/FixA family protein [Dehalococcoidales bacterium]|nr:MAG: electron transfer flavoprotein subunit beta/FixA family protein [Dehalococcoidales bacterium]
MSQVKFDNDLGRVDRNSAGVEINPFDLNALEAAVRIKETSNGHIIVISMGPLSAESSLKDALARGADEAVLLSDSAFSGSDTMATSYVLAAAIKKLSDYDLIICGEKTVDGDTGQVGSEIAEHLGIPHISYVSAIKEISPKLVVSYEMNNIRYTVESGFPVLITVTKDINNPRLPAFSDKMKARRADIQKWTCADLIPDITPDRTGVQGSPTRVYRVTVPLDDERKGRMFRDSLEDAVKEVVTIIENQVKLK